MPPKPKRPSSTDKQPDNAAKRERYIKNMVRQGNKTFQRVTSAEKSGTPPIQARVCESLGAASHIATQTLVGITTARTGPLVGIVIQESMQQLNLPERADKWVTEQCYGLFPKQQDAIRGHSDGFGTQPRVQRQSSTPLPKPDSISQNTPHAKKQQIVRSNLVKMGLSEDQIAQSMTRIESDLDETNKKLVRLEVLSSQIAQDFSQQNAERIIAMGDTFATELITLGTQLNCRELTTLGRCAQIGFKIHEMIGAANNFQSAFTQMGAWAALGPAGIALGATTAIFQLFGPSVPSQETVLLQGISKQITDLSREMATSRQEMREGFLGMEKLHIETFRILQDCLTAMHRDLSGQMASTRIEVNGHLTRIEDSLKYLSDMQLLMARNQYLQPLDKCCAETTTISYRQGSRARRITDALEVGLDNDAENELLTGFALRRVRPPLQNRVRILQEANRFDDSGDQRLCSLLGYVLETGDLCNPLILHYAAMHYMQHVKRFIALYMHASDRFLQKLIEKTTKQYHAMVEKLEDEALFKDKLDNYYEALEQVASAQNKCVDLINKNRHAHYHAQDEENVLYTNEGKNEPITFAQFNLLQPVQTLIDAFEPRSMQHALPDAFLTYGGLWASRNLGIISYRDREEPSLPQAFALRRLYHALRDKKASVKSDANEILCSDYLKLLTFTTTIDSTWCLDKVPYDAAHDFDVYDLTINIERNHSLVFIGRHKRDSDRDFENIHRMQPIKLIIRLNNQHRTIVEFEFETYCVGLSVTNARDIKHLEKSIAQHVAALFADSAVSFPCTHIRCFPDPTRRPAIEAKWQDEREALAIKLRSQQSTIPDEQQQLLHYKTALTELDEAAEELKAYAYLSGRTLSPENTWVTSASLMAEIALKYPPSDKREIGNYKRYSANETLELTPSLTKALRSKERWNKTHFIEMPKLPIYHPKNLFSEVIRCLTAHQYWLKFMRVAHPELAYVDLQSYMNNQALTALDNFRREAFENYLDLKKVPFKKATSKIDYPESNPIQNWHEFKKTYELLHDWTLDSACSTTVVNYWKGDTTEKPDAELHQLQRGWEDNIAFLIQYAEWRLHENLGDPSKLVNFKLYAYGCHYFLLLLNRQDAFSFAQQAELVDAINRALCAISDKGRDLQTAIENIALSEELFCHLFEQYLKTLETILSMEVKETDEEIYAAWIEESQNKSPSSGIFYRNKVILSKQYMLLKNYMALAFGERFSDIMKQFKSSFNTPQETELAHLDAFTVYLSPRENPEGSLREKIANYAETVVTIKQTVIHHIRYNHNLRTFAHYLQTQAITTSLTLVPEHCGEITPSFSDDFVDLLDQYLQYNTQLETMIIRGITLNDSLLQALIACIRKYHNIHDLSLIQVSLKTSQLVYLTLLLPQVDKLNLRGNQLGEQGVVGLWDLVNFVQHTLAQPTFAELDLNHNAFDERGLAYIEAVKEAFQYDENPVLKVLEPFLFEENTTGVFNPKIPFTIGQTSIQSLLGRLQAQCTQWEQQTMIVSQPQNRGTSVLNSWRFYQPSNEDHTHATAEKCNNRCSIQ